MTVREAKAKVAKMKADYAAKVPGYVKRGAKFLDREVEDWLDRVDVGVLDLSNAEVCVLGQAYPGHYDEGREVLAQSLGLGNDDEPYPDAIVARHGFCLPHTLQDKLDDLSYVGNGSLDNDAPFWSILQEEWNRVIVKRLCDKAKADAEARVKELFRG